MRKLIFVLSLAVCGSGLMSGLPIGAEEGGLLMAVKTTSLYDFTMDDIDGKPVNLGVYKGKVLLLVNTASLCGNTPSSPCSSAGSLPSGTRREWASLCRLSSRSSLVFSR